MLDMLVVGSGFSGLMAALFAARAGKSVCVAAQGQGSLVIGGATVDILGYVRGQKAAVRYPLEAMDALDAEHPYRLAGKDNVCSAISEFVEICRNGGYPYEVWGGAERPTNRRVFTCIGTMKPVCLMPQCMIPQRVGGTDVKDAESILIVGIEGLKDFYPRLAAQGLANFTKATIETVMLPCPVELSAVPHNRDLAALDAARHLDSADGRAWFVRALKREAAFARLNGKRAMLLVPPILGSLPTLEARQELMDALGVPMLELVAPPPAVTGQRLRALLMRELRAAGVEIIMNAKAIAPVYAEDKMTVTAMMVESAGRQRQIAAKAFVMATGGVYGGSLEVRPQAVTDKVFGDKVTIIPDVTPLKGEWAEPTAYPDFAQGGSHGFARIGVKVGADFRPVGEDGRPVLNNVWYVGRAVGGYDPASEKSGNGVALVSAYAAVKSAVSTVL